MFGRRGSDASDDEASFVSFAESRRQALLRAAWLMCHDGELAEDMVQIALTKVAARWRRLRTGSPEAYARKVLYRDMVAHQRTHHRQMLLEQTVDPHSPDHAVRTVDRIVLGQALSQLPARQRAVIVLRFYEDLSTKDAAAVLGVSSGTIKSQTHDALATLKKLLGPREVTNGGRERTP